MNKRNVTIPTTSAPPTAQSFSRFGQSTTMPATNQMNQMPQMSMSFQPIQLQASDSNWQVCRTPTGVEYYYNKLTRVTTYNKPDELKSEAERALKVCVLLFNIITQSCPWKEYKTNQGRTYWHNQITQVSVWEEPEELRLYKAELARIQNTSTTASTTSATSTNTFIPTPIENSPFITTISASTPTTPSAGLSSPISTSIPSAATSFSSPSSPTVTMSTSKQPVVEQKITWSTPEEARAAYESLLRDKGIKSKTTWKEAVTLIASDIRYTALRTSGERKQVFSEFVSRRAKEERDEALRRMVSAREAFRTLLSESMLTSRSNYRDAQTMLEKDKRWTDLDESGRQEEFRYYVSKLVDKERDVGSQ